MGMKPSGNADWNVNSSRHGTGEPDSSAGAGVLKTGHNLKLISVELLNDSSPIPSPDAIRVLERSVHHASFYHCFTHQ